MYANNTGYAKHQLKHSVTLNCLVIRLPTGVKAPIFCYLLSFFTAPLISPLAESTISNKYIRGWVLRSIVENGSQIFRVVDHHTYNFTGQESELWARFLTPVATESSSFPNRSKISAKNWSNAYDWPVTYPNLANFEPRNSANQEFTPSPPRKK